ncbi:hypothetical protein NP493_471g01058 [Ridgeia piscesae]|uniref:Uncharacterized protein n=1 Tax=Ridgeia piscesae TaxID=27915 RepID=A0AAD9KZU0_RIDPI|nr:hypothetical protein NP493_471g01058 [Ridgeia piscesae]
MRKVTGEKVTERRGEERGQEMREVDATGGKTNGRKEVRGDVTKGKSITRTRQEERDRKERNNRESGGGKKSATRGDAKRRSYSEAVIEGH